MTKVSEMIFCRWSVKEGPMPCRRAREKQGGGTLGGNRGPCWSLASWGPSWIRVPKIISRIAIRQMWRKDPVTVERDNISFIHRVHSCAFTLALSFFCIINMQMVFCRTEWSHYQCKALEKLWYHYPINLLLTAIWGSAHFCSTSPLCLSCIL